MGYNFITQSPWGSGRTSFLFIKLFNYNYIRKFWKIKGDFGQKRCEIIVHFLEYSAHE